MSSSTTEPIAPDTSAAPDHPPAAGDAGAAIDVLMPQMGTSMVEGTIVAWRVAVGDPVVRDQVLCEVSTDKVDVECPAMRDGTLAEIVVEAGETVDVGTVIARLAAGVRSADGRGAGTPGAEPAAVGTPGAEAAAVGTPGAGPAAVGGPGAAVAAGGVMNAEGSAPGPADQVADGSALGDPRSARREALRHSSPVAARLAAEHGLDVLALEGSGRNGRVTKRDVLSAADGALAAGRAPTATIAPAAEAPMHSDSPYRHDPSIPVAGRAVDDRTPATSVGRPSTADAGAVPAPAGVAAAPSAPVRPVDLGGVAEPASRMRRSIGAAVRRSLDTAAHCTTVVECDMSRIERERRVAGLTALPLLARAAIETLQAFPALNATFDGGSVTRYDGRVHLGIAVSLGEDGLIAPVIHDAQDLSVQGLARRIKDLAARARAGALHPDEVRGGTFTITNPGAAGALMATPVLNLPQVGILDLEAIVRRPVVVTDADGNESIGIRPMVHLCMGWDHRALDGLYAAQFLTALRRRIEG